MRYNAVIAKYTTVDGTRYSCCFPDFPGCTTCTMKPEEGIFDLVHRAEEALRFHINGMRLSSYPVPTETSEALLTELVSTFDNLDTEGAPEEVILTTINI